MQFIGVSDAVSDGVSDGVVIVCAVVVCVQWLCVCVCGGCVCVQWLCCDSISQHSGVSDATEDKRSDSQARS
jgi:hypothetical protein